MNFPYKEISLSILVAEKVISGNIHIKLQYHVFLLPPITVRDEKYDLCGEEIGLTCPLDVVSK